jgi:ribosomal protein L32
VTLLINILGYLGTLAVLLAYYLVSSKRRTAQTWAFQGLNIFGAVTLLWLSLSYHVWPSVALNVAWLWIGIYGVYQIPRVNRFYQRKLHPPEQVECDNCGGSHVPNGIGLPCVPYEEW